MSNAKLVLGKIFGLAVIMTFPLMLQSAWADNGSRWFRGQLHTHTYWSDGRGFPEQAIAAYEQRGYDFLCLSDHNRFAVNTAEWREVAEKEGGWPPEVSREIFDAYVQDFGKDWVETKINDKGTSVRLKMYADLKSKFEKTGKFILIPGVEITQTINRLGVHLSYVNLPLVIPCIKDAGLIKTVKEPKTVSELIALNAAEVEQAAHELQKKYILILNHPSWMYYDIVPQNLIDCPEIRFFEICNGGADYAPHPQMPDYTEKFWDVVNAFRSIRGKQLLYGIGSDDAHFYDAKRIKGNSGVGDAWVMVRAPSLTPESLIEAMRTGDFYASCGVFLDDVSFADKTLSVKIKAEKSVNYRIHFIATKRGFNQTVTAISSPAEKKRPARVIPVYSDDIGRLVKTVEGVEASYKLEDDDLYVRARVEADSPSQTSPHFHPKVKMAWTQPYTLVRVSQEK